MSILFILISLLILVPVVFSILNFKYLSYSLRLIAFLLWVGLLFNLIGVTLSLFRSTSLPMFHFYTIIEFLLLSAYFYTLTKRDYFKKIIQIILAIFLGVVILNKMFLESINKIDNYTLTIESILLLILSSIYLTEYLNDSLLVNLRDYRFLITIGFMIYYGGNLFVFALSNEIDIWIVHNLLILILWTIYTLIFIWQRYQMKSGG